MSRRSKKLPSMSLVALLGLTVNGCDADPGAQAAQRDVYTGPHAFEDCVADWGNEQLCQQRLDKEDAKKMAEANRQNGNSTPVFLFTNGYGVYGPAYSGERVVTSNGQTYRPTTSHFTQRAAFSDLAHGARPSAFSKPGFASRAVSVTSRGGFGATGRGFSSGG